MIRPAALVVLAGFGVPWPARAVGLDDFLGRGYTIVAATMLPGSFTGCVRQHRLTFADGSAFACSRTTSQIGYDARVYVLRLGGDPPSVVLVGTGVLAGELLRLRLHDYQPPLRMNAAPLPDHQTASPFALQPIGPIPSINTLTGQQNTSITEQQDQTPKLSRKNRPNR